MESLSVDGRQTHPWYTLPPLHPFSLLHPRLFYRSFFLTVYINAERAVGTIVDRKVLLEEEKERVEAEKRMAKERRRQEKESRKNKRNSCIIS